MFCFSFSIFHFLVKHWAHASMMRAQSSWHVQCIITSFLVQLAAFCATGSFPKNVACIVQEVEGRQCSQIPSV